MRIANMIKMGLATVRAQATGGRTPLNVMISVTNRCQARCAYCGIHTRSRDELTTGEMITLLDELKQAGTQRVGFWGGEPLLRDDIGELITHASKRCGFFVSLDSNGYLVPQRMESLKDLDALVLSLDGPREIHDRNREPGSHDKVMAAIKVAAGRMPVLTITVLTRENLDRIDYILECAASYGFAASFQLLHHNESLASSGEESLQPSNDQYRTAIRHLLRRKREGASIVSSRAYLEYLLRWPDYRNFTDMNERGIRCWAGSLYCNVDTDGSLYPCSGLVGCMSAPNLRDGGFPRAFARMEPAPCKSCFASCFTEYNLMHALNPGVIANWLHYTRRAGHGRTGTLL